MKDKENYQLQEVFTPTTPARTCFVEREEINDKLVRALRTPGRQIVVYGHTGTGKTTLLINKLRQLYEYHITTRCMKGMKFEQIILDAFDKLSPFYVSEMSTKDNKDESFSGGFDYNSIKLQINCSSALESNRKENRVLPPQLTPAALGRFIGEKKACWVIEDFHKIDEVEKSHLSQMMKVFMDMAEDYPDLKIITLGATNTAREVIEYDHEMKNRVAEIFVPLMTAAEVRGIIEKGEMALNIKIPDLIKNNIVKYCNGLASSCHHLCLNMCDAAGVNETVDGIIKELNPKDYEAAVKSYLEDSSDSVKSSFDKALKKSRANEFEAEIVINALSSFKEDGAARFDILKKIKIQKPKCNDAVLKRKLEKLCKMENGGIVRYDEVSGRYSFSDPIYKAYAAAYSHAANQKSGGSQPPPSLEEIQNLLIKLLNSLPKSNGVTNDSINRSSVSGRA
jgi:phage pi2 protein 07